MYVKKMAIWLKRAIIYNILIDRFARGNSEDWLNSDSQQPVFCGGNIQGIIDKLDYLQDLGINTIFLSPFHPTSAYHGYHVMDFFGVDPRFGTLEIVKKLLNEAHRRNIRIIMDFVINHVSSQHPYFIDARSNPNSQYIDWFKFTKWPDSYATFLVFPELPKLNLNNPRVKEHIIGACLHWLKIGFDGFRLDHIIGVPHEFLDELRDNVKKNNPEAVLIGEAVKGRIRKREIHTLEIRRKYLMYVISLTRLNTSFFLQLQYAHQHDGLLDFFFRDMVKSFLVNKKWYKKMWMLDAILRLHSRSYPKDFSLMPLLDNADHDTFSFLLKNNRPELKEAIRIQFSQNHPVVIFYGNEAGIVQKYSRKNKVYGDKPNGDLAIRPLMPWGDIDREMFEFYKKMIKIKKEADNHITMAELDQN